MIFTSDHLTGVLMIFVILAIASIVSFSIYKTNELEVENNRIKASVEIAKLNHDVCITKLKEVPKAVDDLTKGNEE